MTPLPSSLRIGRASLPSKQVGSVATAVLVSTLAVGSAGVAVAHFDGDYEQRRAHETTVLVSAQAFAAGLRLQHAKWVTGVANNRHAVTGLQFNGAGNLYSIDNLPSLSLADCQGFWQKLVETPAQTLNLSDLSEAQTEYGVAGGHHWQVAVGAQECHYALRVNALYNQQTDARTSFSYSIQSGRVQLQN